MSSAGEAAGLGVEPQAAEIIPVDFGTHEDGPEADAFEDQLMLSLLSDEAREFTIKLAEKSGISPLQIIDSAIQSYQFMCGLLEEGGTLHYLDKYSDLHPIFSSDDSTTTPAA